MRYMHIRRQSARCLFVSILFTSRMVTTLSSYSSSFRLKSECAKLNGKTSLKVWSLAVVKDNLFF
jgi:hypothetical protein